MKELLLHTDTQQRIAELIAYPYQQVGHTPQVEHDTYVAMSEIVSKGRDEVHAWTVHSVDFDGRSPSPAVMDVIVSKSLDNKLREEWVPDGIASPTRSEVVGELSRANPELTLVHNRSYRDVWVHATHLPVACQERLEAVAGIEEAELSLGGIARIAVMGRSFPADVVDRQNKMTEFKDRYAATGLPELSLLSHRQHPFDVLDWRNAPDNIDCRAMAREIRLSAQAKIGESLSVDNSLGTFIEFGEAIVHKVSADFKKQSSGELNLSLLKQHVLTIISSIKQVREVSAENKATEAQLLPNEEIERALTLLNKDDPEAVRPLFIDRERIVWGVLLAGRFLMVASPSPIENLSWISLSKVQRSVK